MARSKPRLPRGDIETELRQILNHNEGVACLQLVDKPHLRSALQRQGAVIQSPADLYDIAVPALAAAIAGLPDHDAMKKALLLDFGIDPTARDLTARGRRDKAIGISPAESDGYLHDRGATGSSPERLSLRTAALRRIERVLSGRIAAPLSAGRARPREFVERLDAAWIQLDRCRVSGRHRAEELPTLLKDADILEADTDLDEARALVEFARYEDNRGLETYRLVQGVALLEVALDSYSGDDGAETALNALLHRS